MCEVTEKNFESKCDEIIGEIQKASFIAIDCEFTGLEDGVNKYSLFDTAQARFNKMQKTFKNLLIIQMGLSMFKPDKDHNKYICSTYTFYLMPMSIFKNSEFISQTKSIDFLCEHKFDFNKLFYEGITYLNKSEEKEFQRLIEKGNLVGDGDNLNKMLGYCSEISKWSCGVENGSETLLELNERDVFVYMLHQEIRKRFPNLWTFAKDSKVLGVRKMKESEKMKLMSSSGKEGLDLNKKLFDSILGFSKIMKALESIKKPVVGHNFFPDLVMIYKQFFNSSPVSYKTFKEDISKIFPNVYDTKRLSFVLKDLLPREQTFHSNNLSNLYLYLREGKGATLVLFSPQIQHLKEEDLKKKDFHDAGFDSYCTGFCFVKMAHIFCMFNSKSKSTVLFQKTIMASLTFCSIKPMKNQVNLIKAQVNYACLDSEDPVSTRPDLLYFQSRTGLAIDIKKLSETLGRFSLVDIQVLNKRSGLLAVGNHNVAEEIVAHFDEDEEIEVAKYSFLKHSTFGQIIMSSTIATAVIVIAAGATMTWRKMSLQ